jgi:hypothetical protein
MFSNLKMHYLFLGILSFISCFYSIYAQSINYEDIKYKLFTVVYNNESVHNVINYPNDRFEVLDVDYHVNMYSVFTHHYFDNCDKNTDHCVYSLQDQFDACQHLLDGEGGQMFYYGVHDTELINIEIKSNGTQVEKSYINHKYQFKGLYVIVDLMNEEIEYNNEMCMVDDIIKIHTYLSEPHNFYRKMLIYILLNENKSSFCPMWVLSASEKYKTVIK